MEHIHVREHVEDLIIGRLSAQRDTDLPDSMIEADFRRLSPVFEVCMAKVLDSTTIPGFTDDDLAGFMLLKAHMALRRQDYDFDRSPHSFFYVAFQRLMRDIIRDRARIKCRSMRWDVTDVYEIARYELDLNDHRLYGGVS